MKSNSSPLTALTSLTKHKELEFGLWLKLQPPWPSASREGAPCRETLTAAMGSWGTYREKRTPRGAFCMGQAGRQHLLPGTPRPASPTSLFLRHLLLAWDCPWRAGSSLGRLPLQLFLTQIRLQRAPGSTGRGSHISGAQDKVTCRVSRDWELPGTGCRREENSLAARA